MRHGGDTWSTGERGLPCQSSQATANRNTEVEGPGTGPSKHSGGSVSFVTTQERLNDSSETPPTVNELYLHLHTVNHDRMTFIDTRSERFYVSSRGDVGSSPEATPDQSVDDEAVYLNVAGECPKGRVYGLGSLGRKKRRYADPGASTSEMPDMVPRAEFNVVARATTKALTLSCRGLTVRPIIPICGQQAVEIGCGCFLWRGFKDAFEVQQNHKLDSLQLQNLQSLDNQ
ncbi:hypothetical protein Sjap_017820 [Stephania japonica]|uniref:Uncharacterized protein n=1 Tax=Stephania japonica TaxID=461633 RepID=A0AAP0I6W5_9MAGN